MRKILHSILCLTMTFVIIFINSAVADTLSNVSVQSAEFNATNRTENGMVRVYLSSLGSPVNLTLTVSGSYSLSNGTSLSNGERLSVSYSSANGVITMRRNGTSYNMGNSFTLRRHSTTGSNGIKIAEARKPNNLYPGDIQLKTVAQNGGGYKLYTIASIYIENYLYGVVPYEMGSSAPMESLKAQAVAARTYTVRMMAARSSWSYDVVDTTGDQTYNGTPISTSNCNKAVDQTKGIVLKYGSAYAATYYSSSNGGQTESIYNAWGTSGYQYLGVKDDPFDYANPYSIVRKTKVYADAGSTANNASLLSLLKSKAVSYLTGMGYNANLYNITIQTISSITLSSAKYASPSKLYTKAKFSMTVGTYNASNVYSAVNVTVTCDIFNELESMLGMGIQSSRNEIWTVENISGGFELQARRYGHGIGMSQRGAMYMAQLGYTYDEILGFYYPGCSREGCTFTNTILAAGSSETITTPEDPVNTDDNTVRGIVSISAGSNLAIRSSKSNSSSLLTVLPNGTSVSVLANDGSWCKITFGSITGYVPTNTLSIAGTVPQEDSSAVSSVDGFATVTATGYLNLRDSGSYSGSILTTAPTGAILTVLSWNSSWAHVQYGTITAYASADYLSFSSVYPDSSINIGTDSEPDSNNDTIYAVVSTGSGSLNMRQFAQAGSTILTTIPNTTIVTVTAKGITWTGITYLNQSGYVMTKFLTFKSDTDNTGDQPITEDVKAIVYTRSGSLNLRQQPKAGSTIESTIPRLATVTVLAKDSDWCQVTYAGITGYVMTAFLQFVVNTEDKENPADETITAVVSTTSGSLNLRAQAQPNGDILARIPQGETILVVQKLADWTYTCYNDIYGYVMNEYLTFSSTGNDHETKQELVSAIVNTESGSLNLRDEPYGNVITQIPQHTQVDVLKKGSAWCYLQYNGIYGYVMTEYLSFNKNDDQDASDDSTAPTTATVSIDASSLNLRVARSDTANVLTAIPNGQVVQLIQQGDDWCKVSYSRYLGYVQTQYLSIGNNGDSTDNTPEEPPAESYAVTAWINTTSGSLNMRETASADANIIVQIPQYEEIEVLSDINATWCKANYANIIGYIMSEYVTTTKPDTSSVEDKPGAETGDDPPAADPASPAMDATLHTPSGDITAYVRPPAGYAALGLYDECSESTAMLTTMPEGEPVKVVRVGDIWCEVLFEGQQGYCLRDGLSYFAE